MTSKTIISNRALSKLGQPRASNVETDGTKAALTMNAMWDSVRDALLQSYPWKFAISRTSLAADGDTPGFGWAYQYTVPTDYLAMFAVTDSDGVAVDYELEGRKILTDEGTAIYLRYIAQITNAGLFPALFAESLACRLAYEGCEEITQNASKKELLLKEYGYLVQQAYTNDAIEVPPAGLPEDDWINARL